jgi:hypothetical protein
LDKSAAAELQNCLIGRTTLHIDRDRVIKVLGITRREKEDFFKKLRSLPNGHFFAQGVAVSGEAVLVHVKHSITRHPEPGEAKEVSIATPAQIKELLPQLSAITKDAQAAEKEERDLQQMIEERDIEIQRLQTELSGLVQAPVTEDEVLRIKAAAMEDVGILLDKQRDADNFIVGNLVRDDQRLRDGIVAIIRLGNDLMNLACPVPVGGLQLIDLPNKPDPQAPPRLTINNRIVVKDVNKFQPISQALDGSMAKGEFTVLTVIAQFSAGADATTISVMTGYKATSRKTYVAKLLQAGMIRREGEKLKATDEGRAALGPSFRPLPTGRALREHWLKELPEGEKVCFQTILSNPGCKGELIEQITGYKPTSRKTYVAKLVARQIVTKSGGEYSPARLVL